MKKIEPYITEFRRHCSLKLALLSVRLSHERAYLHEGTYVDTLIWGCMRVIFVKDGYNRANGVLFKMVKENAQKYLLANPRLKAEPEVAANNWEIDKLVARRKKKVTGTDISYAYWKIAYEMGVIKENTFFKGLESPDKGLKLATLANLTSVKKFQAIEGGKKVGKPVQIEKYDKRMQIVYNNIRNRCYKIMQTMADMLGKDFVGYNVDCIYYIDTPKNRAIVHGYLDELRMSYSQIRVKQPKAAGKKMTASSTNRKPS